MGLKQHTTSNPDFVRCWIETTPHHKAYAEHAKGAVEGRDPPTHMVLENYRERLRIPVETWRACYTKPAASDFDNRMYRWDFAAEMKALVTPAQPTTDQENRDVA